MLTFCAILFGTSVAILSSVIRYRVHLHVEYTPRRRRRSPIATARQAQHSAAAPRATAAAPAVPAVLKDLESALRNLGCGSVEAHCRAIAATALGPADMDTLLWRAIGSAPRSEHSK